MDATDADASHTSASSHLKSTSVAPKPSRKRASKGRGLRVRTGCQSCKARHLKCDETQPICRACQKSARNCVYPQQERHGDAGDAPGREEQSSSDATQNARPADTDELGPGDSRFIQARSENLINEDTTRVNTGNTEEPQAGVGALAADVGGANEQMPHDIPGIYSPRPLGFPSKFPGNDLESTNQRLAEAQAIYDPELFDLSPGSSRDGWPFISAEAASRWWFELLASDVTGAQLAVPARNDLDEAYGQVSSASFQQAPVYTSTGKAIHDTLPACRPNTFDDNEIAFSQQELELFRHFVVRLSGWIDITDPDGHFSTIVPQMALRNQGLASAILALSARHLSLKPTSLDGNTPLQIDQTLAVQYYNETLRYLRREMDNEAFLTSDELLATVLIISTYEMIDGPGGSWEKHLKGVFLIQRSQLIHGESEGLKKRIWWAWLRQDIWAAFRSRRMIFSFYKVNRPCPSLTFWELVDRAIFILGQCVNYASSKEEQNGHANLQQRLDHSVEMRAKLDEWRLCFEKYDRRLPTTSHANLAFQPMWINPPAASETCKLLL